MGEFPINGPTYWILDSIKERKFEEDYIKGELIGKGGSHLYSNVCTEAENSGLANRSRNEGVIGGK